MPESYLSKALEFTLTGWLGFPSPAYLANCLYLRLKIPQQTSGDECVSCLQSSNTKLVHAMLAKQKETPSSLPDRKEGCGSAVTAMSRICREQRELEEVEKSKEGMRSSYALAQRCFTASLGVMLCVLYDLGFSPVGPFFYAWNLQQVLSVEFFVLWRLHKFSCREMSALDFIVSHQ